MKIHNVRKGLCVLLFLVGPVAVADVIYVEGPSTPVGVGTVFNVGVDVSGISDLYAFQFDLNFNPALLSVESVTESAFLPSGGLTSFIPGTIDNVGGTLSATADSLIGAIPGVSGSGMLVQLQLIALAPGVSSLSFANEILLDSSLNDITSSWTCPHF